MGPLHYGAIEAILRSFVVEGKRASVTWGSGKVETVELFNCAVVSLNDVDDDLPGSTMRAWISTGDATVLVVRVNQHDGWYYMGTVDAEGEVVMNRPLRRDVDPSREEDLARCTEFC